jgi:hypothetical protein
MPQVPSSLLWPSAPKYHRARGPPNSCLVLHHDILGDPLSTSQPRLDGHKHTFSQAVRLDARRNGDAGSSVEFDKALRYVEHDPA